jgi:hypothetical protein
METELAKESCEVNPDTPNNPSPSFAHNCLRHSHASPPTSHPKEDISATVLYWFTAMLNKRENLTHKGDPSNHESIQENVSNSSPSFLRTQLPNHPPPMPSTQSQILTISLHRYDSLLPLLSNTLVLPSPITIVNKINF